MAVAAARRHWLIWAAVLPVVLWALVRVLGLDSGFPLVALMAFTPYVAIAALLVAGVAVALRNWAAAGVAALATFCLIAAVLPRAIGDATADAAGRETLGVLSANVLHGAADPEVLVDLVCLGPGPACPGCSLETSTRPSITRSCAKSSTAATATRAPMRGTGWSQPGRGAAPFRR